MAYSQKVIDRFEGVLKNPEKQAIDLEEGDYEDLSN